MNLFLSKIKKFWSFLKQDTWQSWIVFLVLGFVFIKIIFFPLLGFIFLTPFPLVVVESCSMYHQDNFDSWWDGNGDWYEEQGITKDEFENSSFKNGLNKGDIILVSGRGTYEQGDILIFNSQYSHPLIHRIVSVDPYDTKGDNNLGQLSGELDIQPEQFVGKALVRIPGIGWIKLIFSESSRPVEQRGFCK